MESKAERQWLDKGSGDFVKFLSIFTKNPKPMYNPMEFLTQFENLKTIFVHGVMCNKKELEFISKSGSLSHCVVSNRVLNNPLLKLKNVYDSNINLTIGTDGLSSNISLNIWDELRAALFAHMDMDVLNLSKQLILASTRNGAKALNLFGNIEIAKGKNADMISIVLPDCVDDEKQLPLKLILHTRQVKSGYINGERYV
jgi:cytosine/adenosine deaminase-related metal-dependent hydrolase